MTQLFNWRTVKVQPWCGLHDDSPAARGHELSSAAPPLMHKLHFQGKKVLFTPRGR